MLTKFFWLFCFLSIGIVAKAQSLTEVDPAMGMIGQTLTLHIKAGGGTFDESSMIYASLHHSQNDSVIISDTLYAYTDSLVLATFSIPLDATLGVYSLKVYTSNQGVLTKANAFTVNEPRRYPYLMSVNPTNAVRGQKLNLLVTAKDTRFTKSSSIVVGLSGGNSSYYRDTTVIVLNDTQLQASFNILPDESTGFYTLQVDLIPYQNLVLEYCLQFTDSLQVETTLVSVKPPFAARGKVAEIAIMGLNTHFLQNNGNLKAFLTNHKDSLSSNWVFVIHDTRVYAQFTIPANFKSGMYSVSIVSDIDGNIELPESFNITHVGVGEQLNPIGKIFPNPVYNKLYIEPQQSITSLTIIDITGKQIAIDLNDLKQDQTHLVIPVDKLGLRKGIYFIRLESDSGFDYQKFVVE